MCFLHDWRPEEQAEFKSVKPYYTIRYESLMRPFWVFDKIDPEGFKVQNQSNRFEIRERVDTGDRLSVDLIINEVHVIDEDTYVLTVLIPKDTDIVSVEFVKAVRVYSPPGKAKCFIGLSDHKDYLYELHCKATIGSGDGNLSCFQGNQRLPKTGSVSISGTTMRGIFQMTSSQPVSCCSHGNSDNITFESCKDFEWPFHNSQNIQATKQSLGPPSTNADTINDENSKESSCPKHFELCMLCLQFIVSNLIVYLLMY